jgi:hypothetical protein
MASQAAHVGSHPQKPQSQIFNVSSEQKRSKKASTDTFATQEVPNGPKKIKILKSLKFAVTEGDAGP